MAFLSRTALRAMLSAEQVGHCVYMAATAGYFSYFVNIYDAQSAVDILSMISLAVVSKPFTPIQASNAFANGMRRPLKTKGGWPGGISERQQNC